MSVRQGWRRTQQVSAGCPSCHHRRAEEGKEGRRKREEEKAGGGKESKWKVEGTDEKKGE